MKLEDNKKTILVIAQLALGDSIVLIREFLQKIESSYETIILCNSYNYFLFEDYECIIEDWPISRRKVKKFGNIYLNKKYYGIALPSAHLREKIFARIRFPFQKLLIPTCSNLNLLARSNVSLFGNRLKFKLNDPKNHYEIYNQFAAALLNTETQNHQDTFINQMSKFVENDSIICPYSRGSGSYKNIPDEILIYIITNIIEHSSKIYFICDKSEGSNIKDKFCNQLIFLSPQEGYKKLRNKKFKYGFFAESFFNHLMYGSVLNQYTFFTKIDPYHAIAAPPLIKPFYGLDDINF